MPHTQALAVSVFGHLQYVTKQRKKEKNKHSLGRPGKGDKDQSSQNAVIMGLLSILFYYTSRHFLFPLRLTEQQWIWLAPLLVGVASHSVWLTPAYQTPVRMEALAKLRGQDMYASAS